MRKKQDSSNYIVHLATFPPRECGIATFTQDLTTAIDKQLNPITKTKIVAINETQLSFYNYTNKVINQIATSNIEDYVDLAREINKNDRIKVVNIQHEFGLFGGDDGNHLIPFLQVVEKLVITTFHSVLPNPDDHIKGVVKNIIEKSGNVVVMNELSRNVLAGDYNVPKSKIVMIPHGIPSVEFGSPRKYKKKFGLQGKFVLTTFGFLSRGKGVEYAIKAMPEVVKKFPNTVYLILGETHPVVRREEGEEYRNYLNKLVEKLKLKDNVKFYNKYLSLDEILDYLKASDVYLSSSLGAEQSVSGTLSYALGCGRPIISTKNEYAKHIISDNGILVGFKNHKEISKNIIKLLRDEKKRKEMNARSYEKSRQMTWPNVAASYIKIYKKHADIEEEKDELPEVKLDHLKHLTDGFGIIHHAKYTKSERRYGYTTDDNARALLVCTKYYKVKPENWVKDLIIEYLDFLDFIQRPSGRFAKVVNFSFKRDSDYSDDVQGRCIWALGYLLSQQILSQESQEKADKIFHKALKNVSKIKAPRAVAFAITGLYHYLKKNKNNHLKEVFKKMSLFQYETYKSNSASDWRWFEEHLTYSNSKLSESMFYAHDLLGYKRYLNVAEKSLEFLTGITYNDDHYVPIGQNGWYFRNKKRSYFDQQPEDAASMVETKSEAYKITGKEDYINEAFAAFRWFLGKNHLNIMVYDESTGGCHDGLGKYGMNLNQGAESTISYLLARLSIEEAKNK